MKNEKNAICILGHLGLGDHIVCNAIYRDYAARYDLVCIPVKYHNCPSVAFMLRDLPNVVVRPVEDDEDAKFFFNNVWKWKKIGLGCFTSDQMFTGQEWDREFYRHAQVEFSKRWDGWKCERPGTGYELFLDWQVKSGVYIGNDKDVNWAFVHDDRSRGIEIDYKRVNPVIKVHPYRHDHIFMWWHVITIAPVIHCICSSFALFIDSIDLPLKPKLFLHAYARQGEPLPVFRHNWEILK